MRPLLKLTVDRTKDVRTDSNFKKSGIWGDKSKSNWERGTRWMWRKPNKMFQGGRDQLCQGLYINQGRENLTTLAMVNLI